MKRDGRDCRSAAAKKRTQRARFFDDGDDAWQERNQFLPIWLMQLIAESIVQLEIAARCERRGNCASIRAIFRRNGVRNL